MSYTKGMMNETMQRMERTHKRRGLVISIIIILLSVAAVTGGYIWWKKVQHKNDNKLQTFEELMNAPVPEMTAQQRAQFDALMAEPVPAQTPAEKQAFINLMLEDTSANPQ